MVTRYIVDLDEGGVLMVIRQNLETTSSEVLEARGRRVRLAWRPEHTYVIEIGGRGGARMNEMAKRRLGYVALAGFVVFLAFAAAGCGGDDSGGGGDEAAARSGPRQRPRRDQGEGARGRRGQPRPVGRLRRS